MGEKNRKKIVMCAEEIFVLAAIAGIREYVGLCRKPGRILNREEVYYTLYALNKEGTIVWNARKLQGEKGRRIRWSIADDTVRQIFEAVRNAESVLMIYRKNGSGPEYCCYVGKEIVLSQVSAVDKNAVRFSRLSGEDVMKKLEEEEILPGRILPMDTELMHGGDRQNKWKTWKALSLYADAEEYLRDDTIRSIIDVYDAKMAVIQKRIYVFRQGWMDGLVIQDPEKETTIYDYDKEKMRHVFSGHGKGHEKKGIIKEKIIR